MDADLTTPEPSQIAAPRPRAFKRALDAFFGGNPIRPPWRRTNSARQESPAPSRNASAKIYDRPRHAIGDWIGHAPQTLRALVRADEIWLVVLAAFVGCAAGLCVTAMSATTQYMHELLFNLSPQERLSGRVDIQPIYALATPALGGLAVGLLGLVIARWWPRRAVDPIEANALFGGHMSLTDSLVVVFQTILSTGVGASVGLEAGYTQLGSAIASRLGRSFRVRRSDLRLLVGCGAAGAIGAAFNAPLTGAFYAFELVIGTYSLITLAPVVVASLTAVSVVRVLIPDEYGYDVRVPSMITPSEYIPILLLGVVCAGVGICVMRGVTLTEEIFRRSRVPVWVRPAIGGLAVGLLALASPQVLSSGHAALRISIDAPYSLWHIALLFVLKATASAISLGSGFRGGLFFASLFLGALLGKLFAAALAAVAVMQAVPPIVCALVAMSGLAVAIVGGPLTMAFLTLESTGSLPLTVAVVGVSVISALTVRRTFGYSFATWRFHLRGESIRSAVDIGWVRSLTVGRMMRREVRTIRADTPLASFRRDFPLGANSRVVVVDERDRYAGIVQVAEVHGTETVATTISELLHHKTDMLLPQMTIKESIAMFEQAESDALAVVDGNENRKVIGLLTEQYALRRYSEELDRRRRELSGE